MEAVGASGQDGDVHVGVLGQGAGDTGIEGVGDQVLEAAELAGQIDHLGQPGPGGPGDHPGEQAASASAFDPEHFPQLFLDQVGAEEWPVRGLDRGQGFLLGAGQVVRVLQYRPSGALFFFFSAGVSTGLCKGSLL